MPASGGHAVGTVSTVLSTTPDAYTLFGFGRLPMGARCAVLASGMRFLLDGADHRITGNGDHTHRHAGPNIRQQKGPDGVQGSARQHTVEQNLSVCLLYGV
jgi:hypothetical protein